MYHSRFSLTGSFSDSSGRFVFVDFSLGDCSFRVASIYAPNRNPERNMFFETTTDLLDPSIPTFLCGDLNCVSERNLDRCGSDPSDSSRESSLNLHSLFNECCVTDIWRHLNPDLPGYTWLKPDGSISSRIDMIGCPVSWLHLVEDISVFPCPYSDHSALVLDVSTSSTMPRGTTQHSG